MLKKKEQQLDQMNDNQVVTELKKKAQPTFGTKAERLNRLKKAHGKIL